MLRYPKIVSVSLLLVIVMTIAVTTSAGAAATSAKPGVVHTNISSNSPLSLSTSKTRSAKPNDTQQCFNVSVNSAVTGTNTISVHGIASFFCGLTDYGGIEVTSSILCPGGVAPGPATVSKYFPAGIKQNPSYSYLTNFTGYCEHCVNHVAVSFPYFTLTTSVYVYSYVPYAGDPVQDPSSYTLLVEGSGGPVNNGLYNSSAYRIPC